MRFGVLGPLAVWTAGGEPVAIPGLKVRALLADLLVHEGRPVSTDRLVADLWGDDPPANPAGALQVRVSQLRRALEDAEPGGRDLVVSRSPGYLHAAEPGAVDAGRFAELVREAATGADPRVRAALLSEALDLWRGPAFADFGDEEFTRPVIARLAEQRLAALELRAEARLELGEHSLLAGELADLVAEHPLRERLRAAHLRALYRAGRPSEALESFADLRRRLDDELGLEPGPELVALQAAILEQDPALGPPGPAPARPVSNLPAALTELVGREAVVDEVRSLLGTARLVTLTGSGGVGKTRLGIETAGRMVDECADGVWLVELAAVGPGQVAEAIMAVLSVRQAASLREALRAKQLLLVLDNCEHVVEAVAELAGELLAAAPGLRVLATSQEPLGLAGEAIMPVPPLDPPSAARLFRSRAGLPPGREDGEVETLCARLDGIPLALELAATRVRALGVGGLLSRLDDRFRLLSKGHRGAPARQRTLRAVIDWSWGLLTEPERVVLRRLAVHADGCTLEAAEAVCDVADTLDLLARLVDRSLLVVAGGPRYRLLESVAAYCMERLEEAGEVDAVRERHHRYYAELAGRADLRGPEQQHWLACLDAESANLRAALAGPDALRLANSLAWYWFLRARPAEARRSLETALSTGDGSAADRAAATAWLAGFSVLSGESAGWAARRDATLALFDGVEDRAARAMAEWFLADAESDLGDLPATEALLNRALDTFESLGHHWGMAAALSTRAKLAHVRGDLAALEHDATRSAELFRELGDRWGVLLATEWVGALAELTGDYERAIRLHREGLGIADELGLWTSVSARLSWLGWISLQLGDYTRAREYGEQALRLAVEQDYSAGKVFAELGLAFAARRDGKLDIAETHLNSLLATARRQDAGSGHALHESMVLTELGFVAELRGDAGTALARHAEAFDIAGKLGAPGNAAFALEGLAGAITLSGTPELAARLLGAADAIRTSAGIPAAPTERDEIHRVTAAVRAALGENGFAAAFALGGETDPGGPGGGGGGLGLNGWPRRDRTGRLNRPGRSAGGYFAGR